MLEAALRVPLDVELDVAKLKRAAAAPALRLTAANYDLHLRTLLNEVSV